MDEKPVVSDTEMPGASVTDTTGASAPKPTMGEIQGWLTSTYPAVRDARSWAAFLEGLPWGYIKPVCQIAVMSHHDHPAVALSATAGLSTDLVFKLTVRNHLADMP